MRRFMVCISVLVLSACGNVSPEKPRSVAHKAISATWVEEARLWPEELEPGSPFGEVVDISGDLLIAVSRPEYEAGRVFTFYRTTDAWEEDLELVPTPLPSDPEVRFHVAIDGVRAVVGAYNQRAGKGYGAWVFVREPSGWKQEAELTPPGGLGGTMYGVRVAISGNTAAIASPPPIGATNGGSVHVFVRAPKAKGWTHEAELGKEYTTLPRGFMLALDADTLLCGSDSLKMLVYQRTTAGWGGATELTPPSTATSSFGQSRTLADDTIVIGDPAAEEPVPSDWKESNGAAFVYRVEGKRWVLKETLFPLTSSPSYWRFGWSLAASNEAAVVATESSGGLEHSALFYYRIDGGQWTLAERFSVGARVEDLALSYDSLALGTSSREGGRVIVLRAAELTSPPDHPTTDDGGIRADADAGAIDDTGATDDTSSSTNGCDCSITTGTSTETLFPLLLLICLVARRVGGTHHSGVKVML